MLGGAVRSVWIAALVGVVVLAGGACGGEDNAESTDPAAASTTSAPATTTTLDDETQKEEAATAAYLAFYDAYRAATANPVNPQEPEVQALMTGDHKAMVTRNLEDRRARGQAVRHPENTRSTHTVRSAELRADGSVEIFDCEVDDAIVYDVSSGAVVDDEVVTNLVTGTVVQEGGRWKTAYINVLRSWPGVTECDD
jgi:hypothetical protein